MSDMSSPHLKHARQFAQLMDSQYSLFGIKFGLENIVGLIPGFGDFFGLTFSLYLLWIGYQMKLPGEKLVRMMANVFVDALIGTIPLVGDLGDLFFKANIRNLRILEEHERGEVIEGEVIRE